MSYIDQAEMLGVVFDWAVPQPWLDDFMNRVRLAFMEEGMSYPDVKKLPHLVVVWAYPNPSIFGYPMPRFELGRAMLEAVEHMYYDPYINKVVFWMDGERCEEEPR